MQNSQRCHHEVWPTENEKYPSYHSLEPRYGCNNASTVYFKAFLVIFFINISFYDPVCMVFIINK